MGTVRRHLHPCAARSRSTTERWSSQGTALRALQVTRGHSCQPLPPSSALVLSQGNKSPPRRSDWLTGLKSTCKLPQHRSQGVLFVKGPKKQPWERWSLWFISPCVFRGVFCHLSRGFGFVSAVEAECLCVNAGCEGLHCLCSLKCSEAFCPHLQPVTRSWILPFTARSLLPSLSITSSSPDPCVFLPHICNVPYYLQPAAWTDYRALYNPPGQRSWCLCIAGYKSSLHFFTFFPGLVFPRFLLMRPWRTGSTLCYHCCQYLIVFGFMVAAIALKKP